MPVQHFETPEDIEAYGFMINGFSDIAKALCNHQKIGLPQSVITHVVGLGKYNDPKEPEAIIYGPEKTAAARNNNSGLFGAFFFIHRPQIWMMMRGPKLLAEAGCKLEATVGGKIYNVPLQDAHFDYTERVEHTAGNITHGQVKLSKAITGTAQDGSIVPLPKDTLLTSATDSRKWNATPNSPAFQIVDAQNRPLETAAAIQMLWGHVTAMGFKKQGKDSAKFNTLMEDGVDDDFNAQAALIECLASFNHQNGIDLMPKFNDYMREASDDLNKHDRLLASISAVRAIASQAQSITKRDYGRYINISPKHYEALIEIGRLRESMDGIAKILDLKLPKYTLSSGPPEAREVLTDCYNWMREMCFSGYRIVLWERIRADAEKLAYSSGGKAEMKKVAGAIEIIRRKWDNPQPDENFDVRPQVDLLRAICDLAEQKHEKMLHTDRLKSSGFARDTKKMLKRLRELVSRLDDANGDLQQFRGKHLKSEMLEQLDLIPSLQATELAGKTMSVPEQTRRR